MILHGTEQDWLAVGRMVPRLVSSWTVSKDCTLWEASCLWAETIRIRSNQMAFCQLRWLHRDHLPEVDISGSSPKVNVTMDVNGPEKVTSRANANWEVGSSMPVSVLACASCNHAPWIDSHNRFRLSLCFFFPLVECCSWKCPCLCLRVENRTSVL